MKIIYTTFFITLFFLPFLSFSQDSLFSKVFYRDGIDVLAQDFCTTNEDGIFIATNQGYMILDSVGTILSSKEILFPTTTFSIQNDQWGIGDRGLVKVISTSDSCFVIGGNMIDGTNNISHGICMKMNQQGDTLWTIVLNSIVTGLTMVHGIAEALDSSYFVMGQTGKVEAPLFIANVSKDGNLLWSHKITWIASE